MKIPRSSEIAKESFRSLFPKDSRITIRPMFGNLAGFVNGNMFTGLYGEDLFVRLFGDDREELLRLKGTSVFEPMKGRQMKDYVVAPIKWMQKLEIAQTWITKALEGTAKLPKKKK